MDADKKVIEAGKIIWGTEDGVGFVSQSGVFTGTRQGKGVVAAYVHGKKIHVTVQIGGAAVSPDAPAAQKDPDSLK